MLKSFYFRFFLGRSFGKKEWPEFSCRSVRGRHRSASWVVPEFLINKHCYERWYLDIIISPRFIMFFTFKNFSIYSNIFVFLMMCTS